MSKLRTEKVRYDVVGDEARSPFGVTGPRSRAAMAAVNDVSTTTLRMLQTLGYG